jgi:peptide chain release factor 2
MEESRKVSQKIKALKNKVAQYEDLKTEYEDTLTLAQLGNEEEDASVLSDVRKQARSFIEHYDNVRIATLLGGEHDSLSCILSLHAGAGGTEACDWVEMLSRMYVRWAEKHGFSVEILDSLPGDEAGTKSITMQISGLNAFGYLKSEKGVHRLIRISPFDSSGRRHTSFASCDALPDIDDDIDFDINLDDLRIDTYRSSGAGGQHVNKTDSAIRITHIPTGIVVQCQNQRSQHKNKDYAMKMLKSKLYELEMEKQVKAIKDLRGEMKEIGFGSQIRTYTFHPYNLVKDHRTGAETGNVSAVMDGDLDAFINAYLVAIAGGR